MSTHRHAWRSGGKFAPAPCAADLFGVRSELNATVGLYRCLDCGAQFRPILVTGNCGCGSSRKEAVAEGGAQ